MDCGGLKEALPPDDPLSGCETQVLVKVSRAVWIWAHVRITATREDMARWHESNENVRCSGYQHLCSSILTRREECRGPRSNVYGIRGGSDLVL